MSGCGEVMGPEQPLLALLYPVFRQQNLKWFCFNNDDIGTYCAFINISKATSSIRDIKSVSHRAGPHITTAQWSRRPVSGTLSMLFLTDCAT